MKGLDLSAVYVLVAAAVTLVVEWIRKASDKISGIGVNLIAWVVGIGATFVPILDIASDAEIQTRGFAGFILAAAASVVAEIKKALANKGKPPVVNNGVNNAPYRADEGWNADDPVKDPAYPAV